MIPVDYQPIFVLAVFSVVVLIIALNVVHMTVAAMLGISALALSGLVRSYEIENAFQHGGNTLCLLFGGMILVRILLPTGLFQRAGYGLTRFAGGSGRRLILGIILMVSPLCAVLPNATVVMLLAPVIIRAATLMRMDFVPLLILLVAVSNSAGLLTLVGDPATFIVGSSIGMSFETYLQQASLGGVLALLALVPLAAWLLRPVWKAHCPLRGVEPPPALEHRGFMWLALAIFVAVVVLFVLGNRLPVALTPPGVAFLGASFGLLALYGARVEPVADVLRDIDWGTLLFIGFMFAIVEVMIGTGLLHGAANLLAGAVGADMRLAAVILLASVALATTVVPNIPVVLAMVVVAKSYLIITYVVPAEALGRTFLAWPEASLPVFLGMMYGATLGGNATVIGASSNIVAAGIAARNGRPIAFLTFLRYGGPITAVQLAVALVYVLILQS